MVEIQKIILDDQTQSRTGNDSDLIEHYAERLREGDEFPPVDLFTVDGSIYWLGDGIHRTHAHVVAGIEEIEAVVHEGDERAARIFACSANKLHGLHRSNADKRRAAEIMLELEPKWSNRKIGDHCGISYELVGDVRKSLEATGSIEKTETRIGADGKEYKQPQVSESDTCETPKGIEAGPAFDESDDYETEVRPYDEPAAFDLDVEAKSYKLADDYLRWMAREFRDIAEDRKRGAHLIDKIVRWEKMLEDMRAEVRQMTPVAVCDKCAGDGCNKCSGAGFLTKSIAARHKGE